MNMMLLWHFYYFISFHLKIMLLMVAYKSLPSFWCLLFKCYCLQLLKQVICLLFLFFFSFRMTTICNKNLSLHKRKRGKKIIQIIKKLNYQKHTFKLLLLFVQNGQHFQHFMSHWINFSLSNKEYKIF